MCMQVLSVFNWVIYTDLRKYNTTNEEYFNVAKIIK